MKTMLLIRKLALCCLLAMALSYANGQTEISGDPSGGGGTGGGTGGGGGSITVTCGSCTCTGTAPACEETCHEECTLWVFCHQVCGCKCTA
jgi:hypothetical protein